MKQEGYITVGFEEVLLLLQPYGPTPQTIRGLNLAPVEGDLPEWAGLALGYFTASST